MDGQQKETTVEITIPDEVRRVLSGIGADEENPSSRRFSSLPTRLLALSTIVLRYLGMLRVLCGWWPPVVYCSNGSWQFLVRWRLSL